MNYRLIFTLLVSFCIFVSGLAQTQTPTQTKPPDPQADDKDDVVRITTNLVQVDAVVTKTGKPVTTLTADDFEIYEGVFHLNADLEPGDYFLQVAMTDKASKNKQPSSTQWVGFEIVSDHTRLL